MSTLPFRGPSGKDRPGDHVRLHGKGWDLDGQVMYCHRFAEGWNVFVLTDDRQRIIQAPVESVELLKETA